MTLIQLDSRMYLGTDIEQTPYADGPGDLGWYVLYPKRQTVRVILGRFGAVVRMSAPEIDIVTEGQNQEQAWVSFLAEISKREDAAWLTFDVGPTRRDEIRAGLNIPEDEDWSELMSDQEDD